MAIDSGKGLNEDVIRFISKSKNEPEWMLDYRLKAYNHFVNEPLPKFGPSLKEIDFDDFKYFVKASQTVKTPPYLPARIYESRVLGIDKRLFMC